jgi:hypothetical protein
MEGQLLKTVGTTEIYVDENGRFQATIGDRTLTRKSLSDLEKEIAKQGGGLQILWLRRMGSVFVTKIVGIVARGYSTRFRLLDGSLKYQHDNAFYLYDAGAEAKLHEIEQQVTAENARHKEVLDGYDAEWSTITRTLILVRDSNFNDLLAKSQQDADT